ncbi:uncharacterized protein LOC135225347 [Macrobrachium nipponense]|uniref:uncharacterized protein LOC135225347 n=1 Tax=Macrobrachium nipponense TaxID=159736 RepID=UPI0030C7FF82
MAATEEKTTGPQSLITEEYVREALKADKGGDASLKSWKVVDFTKPGDNYVGMVTSVAVKYSMYSKEEFEVSYIVKLTAQKNIDGFSDLTKIFFSKEGKFYQEVLPALNKAITLAGQEQLHLPRCLYVSLEDGKEHIYFEDLRTKGFKMFDRKKGMDQDHVALVMAELARLHSASYLWMRNFQEEATVAKKYEFLVKDWLTFTPSAKKVFLPVFENDIDTGVKMLEKIGGYETAIDWLRSLKPEVADIISVQIQSTRFNSICHGDCWNNNILFRYNDEGRPIDVMLLDLQLCRKASLASDLNYFLYTSVTGDIRRPNIDDFMSVLHYLHRIPKVSKIKENCDKMTVKDHLPSEKRPEKSKIITMTFKNGEEYKGKVTEVNKPNSKRKFVCFIKLEGGKTIEVDFENEIRDWKYLINEKEEHYEALEEVKDTGQEKIGSRKERIVDMIKDLLMKNFTISKVESSEFRFTGIDIVKTREGIEVSMEDYAQSIEEIKEIRKIGNDEPLTKTEYKVFRSGLRMSRAWLEEVEALFENYPTTEIERAALLAKHLDGKAKTALRSLDQGQQGDLVEVRQVITKAIMLEDLYQCVPGPLAVHLNDKQPKTLAVACRLADDWETFNPSYSTAHRRIVPPSHLSGSTRPKDTHQGHLWICNVCKKMGHLAAECCLKSAPNHKPPQNPPTPPNGASASSQDQSDALRETQAQQRGSCRACWLQCTTPPDIPGALSMCLQPVASPEKETITPQSLITEEHVQEALKSDKGGDALLKSWEVVDFTKPGDNYACIVTSVEVKYLKNNEECEVSYVVKLNSLRNLEGFPELTTVMFEKEGRFYQEILPALNAALLSSGQEPLHLPKCFHVFLGPDKEQIYFEDLRARGFKMFERRKGMDKDHVVLVLKEIARLHSASYLLMRTCKEGDTVTAKYEFLSKDWLNFTPSAKELFVPMFQKEVDTGVMMLEKVGGYETTIDWLKSFKNEVEDVLGPQMLSEIFNTICHGDCWNNNILFRYDAEGHPTEVMLVDLQLCREASIGTDLSYFLYTSLTGDVRKPHLDDFMSVYHSSYKEVLEGGHLQMYFTQEDLKREFRCKNKYGLLFVFMILPALLMEPSEVPEFTDKDMETLALEFRAIALDKLNTNPLFKHRFLSVLDELKETGLIS